MDKKFWSKGNILALSLSIAAFVWMLVLLLYTVFSKGVIGWVTWEYLGLLALVLLCLIAVIPLLLFVLIVLRKKAGKAVLIVNGLVMLFAIGFTIFLGISGNITGITPNLNFYCSADGYLSEDGNLNIAVASDSHWGASSSNAEARNNIMDTIESGSYDLMIHGGDVVDLGMVKSYYTEAVSDMEAHLPTQKVHFIMGNHDALVNGEKNFRKIFQPGETSLNQVLELAPNVHWVILNMIWDNREVKASDVAWLKTTLSKYSSDDCVIVETHAFFYGTGGKSGMAKWYDVENVIDRITPVFEEYDVDLVVSGHIHTMEMMKMNDVNYCLVGPFGGSRYDDTTVKTKAESTFWNGTDYGFTTFGISSSGTITVNFRNEHGVSLYETVLNYKN